MGPAVGDADAGEDDGAAVEGFLQVLGDQVAEGVGSVVLQDGDDEVEHALVVAHAELWHGRTIPSRPPPAACYGCRGAPSNR